MVVKYSKSLYSKAVLLKAAYSVTETTYVHLDADDAYYYVSLTPKDDSVGCSVGNFDNQMLFQAVRQEVFQETKTLRELIAARAMASTIIDESNDSPLPLEQGSYSETSILQNWFDTNET